MESRQTGRTSLRWAGTTRRSSSCTSPRKVRVSSSVPTSFLFSASAFYCGLEMGLPLNNFLPEQEVKAAGCFHAAFSSAWTPGDTPEYAGCPPSAPITQTQLRSLSVCPCMCVCVADYKRGFGGRYGVEVDKQDQCALGYEHKEHLAKHQSQKGTDPNLRLVLAHPCLDMNARIPFIFPCLPPPPPSLLAPLQHQPLRRGSALSLLVG